MNTLYPTFRWLERGHGDPVVLLHGLMGTMEHWDGTLEALAGHGPGDPDPRRRAGRGVGRGAHALRRRLHGGTRPAAGRGRRELARRPPGAGAGPSLSGARERADPHRLVGSPRARLHPRRAARPDRGVRPRPDGGDLLRRHAGDAELGGFSATGSHHARLGPARAPRRRSAKRSNLEARLGKIRVPTLLVWGKDDRITPPEIAERFRALLPDAHLELIANCGHAPMLEQPLIFNALVEDWLDETHARRRAAVRRASR